MVEALDQTESQLNESISAQKQDNEKIYQLEVKISDMEQEHSSFTIKSEIESSNLQTKVKLLEDALTRRNVDVEQAEENNRQLLSLLEKYDNKLDELQEDNELKDMKIFEYERQHLGDRPKIRIESIEDKVKFLVQVMKRLRDMYLDDAQDRIDQTLKLSPGAEVLYPQLPSDSQILKMKATDKQPLSDLGKEASRVLKQMEILEKNRETRELLEGQEHSKEGDTGSKDRTQLVYPDIDESASGSDIMRLKKSKESFKSK